MSKLLIIDGNALIHRAYHAIPDFMSNGENPTNAVYGFASVLHKVRSEIKPTHLLVCFDTPAPTFRDEMFKDYRAQRPETDKELKVQFPLVRDFLNAAGIEHYELDGVEADDLIAVAVKRAREKSMSTVILTGDKDIFQLIDNNTFVLTPQIGYAKNGKLYDRKGVIKKFGVPPEKVADWKALVGDPSDNYKGVKGIGPKMAVKLINKFASIENIYDNVDKVKNKRIRSLLIDNKEDALMAKKLAVLVDTIKDFDIDVSKSEWKEYDEKLKDFFDEYNFRSLKKRYFTKKTVSVNQEKSETQQKKEQAAKDQLGLF